MTIDLSFAILVTDVIGIHLQKMLSQAATKQRALSELWT